MNCLNFKFVYLLLIVFIFPIKLVAQIFEGEIHYEIEVVYKGDNDRYEQYYESEKFGDTVIVSISSDGRMKREFINSSKSYGSDVYLYDPVSNRQMATYNFTDTIYWYLADTNIVENHRINNDCESEIFTFNDEILSCISTIGYDPFLNLDVKSKHYYLPGKYQFNFKSWSINKDFMLNEIYKKSKSNFLIIDMDYGNYEYKMKAFKVIEKKLDDSVFIFEESRPLKNQ